MAKEIEHDVFVSFRSNDADVKSRVVGFLRSKGYDAVCQDDMGTANDHEAHAKVLIEASHVVVFILHPKGFKRPDGSLGAQFAEVQAAAAAAMEREAEDLPPLGVIPILLQEAGPDGVMGPTFETYPRLPQFLKGKAAGALVTKDRDDDAKWQQFLLQRISAHFSDNKVKTKGERLRERDEARRPKPAAVPVSIAEPPKPASPPTTQSGSTPLADPELSAAFDFADREENYLMNRADDWAHGRFDSLDGDASMQTVMFHHDPRRFIELNGRLLTQEAGPEAIRAGEAADRIEPIFYWLVQHRFDPDFLIVEGEPGCGKTTTLTSLAALLASLRSPEVAGTFAMSELATSLSERRPEWANDRAACPIPIVMRASELATALHSRGAKQEDDAVARVLFAYVCQTHLKCQASPQEFIERLKVQSYCFFVDALDDLEASTSAWLTGVLSRARLMAGKGQLKVIASVRDSFSAVRGGGYKVIELQPMAESQREEFISRFASAIKDGAQRERFEKRARKHSANPAMRDVLRSPLFLSAACHLTQDHADLDEQRPGFCKDLIEHLIEQAVRDIPGDAADVAAEFLQTVLQDFATRAIPAALRFERAQRTIEQLWSELIGEGGFPELDRIDDKVQWTLDRLKTHTALIRVYPNEVAFTHQLFKEFLAACYAVKRFDLDADRFVELIKPQRTSIWREVVVFVPSVARKIRPELRRRYDASKFLQGLVADALKREDAQQAASYAGLAIDSAEANAKAFSDEGREKFIESGNEFLGRFGSHLPLKEKERRIRQLAQIAAHDGEPEVDAEAIFHFVRNLAPGLADFAPAPAGLLSVGKLGKLVAIACAPVLACEYRIFLESEDRLDRAFWGHVPRNTRAKLINDAHDTLGAAREAGVDRWEAQVKSLACPVTFVTWFEAVAYCAWLENRLRRSGRIQATETVRLLSEDEWRQLGLILGGNGRYPWGNAEPGEKDAAIVNWRDADLDAPSAIGVFPPIAGIWFDFGSNVQSWGLDDSWHWPRRAETAARAPVLGGSWVENELKCRIGRPREALNLDRRSQGVGIRVAIAKLE
jgi:hypothetical protein